MKYIVLSCSLNSASRCRKLAELAMASLLEQGAETELIDLSDLNLPMCDGAAVFELPAVKEITTRIDDSCALLLSVPIYNFDVNAAAKNLLELTGDAWLGKVVGFLCTAGGRSSYMSVMSFANSLILDYRCHIVPRFVYSPFADLEDPEYGESAIARRTLELAAETIRLARALGRGPGRD